MKKFIKVYSHPRSGTHFLMKFLAENLYRGTDLSSDNDIFYGHWSNRKLLEGGEPQFKLFGNHLFPQHAKKGSKIYIQRDGKEVIASVWNAGFYNKNSNPSFSHFLRNKIDWLGGPGQKSNNENMTIIEHWYNHVQEWNDINDPELLICSYEDLKSNPNKVLREILWKFNKPRYFKTIFKKKMQIIDQKIGIKPNSNQQKTWSNLFSEADLDFYYSEMKRLQKNHPL